MTTAVEKKTGFSLPAIRSAPVWPARPTSTSPWRSNAVDHVITGLGRVTQAINPPTDVRSKLAMTRM